MAAPQFWASGAWKETCSTPWEVNTAWEVTHSLLMEKAVVQTKASCQTDLSHRWTLMSSIVINNTSLQLQGFQTPLKDGWETRIFAVANAYSRFFVWSKVINMILLYFAKTSCSFYLSSYKHLKLIKCAISYNQQWPSRLILICYWPLFLQKAW